MPAGRRRGVWKGWVVALATAMVLAACAENKPAPVSQQPQPSSAPTRMGSYKVGKPYQIDGTWYYPQEDYSYSEEGVSSWYGPDFNGKLTANGETYDMMDLTAAHRTLPMPSVVRVTNLENGRSMVLRVNDRGPFAKNRIIDVSKRAAQLLGFHTQGTTRVKVEILADESRALKAQAIAGTGEMPAVQAAPRAAVVSQSLDSAPLPPPAASHSSPPPASSNTPVSYRPPPPASAPSSSGGGGPLWVQAGSFAERGNAEKMQKQLRAVGSPEISAASADGRRMYRVRLGPYASAAEAGRVLSSVRAHGGSGARIVSD